MTDQIMLAYNTEPTGETPNNSTNPNDADANLAADFGFYGMSIGSLVFMDTDNSGAFDGSDMGIANVTVNLYSADGNTLLSTTTTNADGQYLFAGLAEGDYMVGVDTTVAALDGKISADDIATSGMPNTTDNDDNGVTFTPTEVRSNVFTLNAGNAPTGEADQGETTTTGLGSPAVTDNPNTPDANSNLHVDFGFKPVCPTITNPQGAQTICATDSGTDLSVETDQNTVDIRFVRFTTAQTGNAMYSGGTQIGSDVTPSGASNPFGAAYTFNTSDFPNATTAPITYYVYAILATAPAEYGNMLRNSLAEYNKTKTDLVAALVANKANTFTQEYLSAKPVEELRGLVALAQAAQPVVNESVPVPMFVGQAVPANLQRNDATPVEQRPLPTPRMVFEQAVQNGR